MYNVMNDTMWLYTNLSSDYDNNYYNIAIVSAYVCYVIYVYLSFAVSCQIYFHLFQKRKDGICVPGRAKKKAEMDFKSTRWPDLIVGVLQYYNVDNTGNMWSNDQDKFGQKLMEKMGWSQGKGLGANEDGRVQVVGAGWSCWLWLKIFLILSTFLSNSKTTTREWALRGMMIPGYLIKMTSRFG